MRRRVAGLAALSCLLLATGCGGGDDGSTGSPRSGSSRAAGATTIDVTFRGGTVTPSGPRTRPGLFAAPHAVHPARLADAIDLLAAG